MIATEAAIVATDLRRVFRKRKGWFRSGEEVVAVKGVSFAVPKGTIFGMLGPNGAGKTTTIKMLSTLLVPTEGTATVNGFDVVRDELQVRRQLGVLFGGDRGLYNALSGWENLRYFGRLYGMRDEAIERRGRMLLDRIQLGERAGERVEGFSRGMKQRLHIAKTLLHDPAVLILDEPTIGLDPAAAIEVRRLIADLVPEHTVLLTTHDMYEADELCREIAIIDRGEIVAQGTPEELKATAEVERQVVIRLAEAPTGGIERVERQVSALPTVTHVRHYYTDDGEPTLVIRCDETTATLDEALAVLREAGTSIRAVQVKEPSLEDAFLAATGREFEEVEEVEDATSPVGAQDDDARGDA
jgi:daunorubicin resistance ABC transporter ATP-binding subunit